MSDLIVNPYVFASSGGDALDDAILATGPWAYWRGDETSGSVFADSSGNGRDADVVSGTLANWTGPDGIDYGSAILRYNTTALRLNTASPVTCMMFNDNSNTDADMVYGQGTGTDPAQSGRDWTMQGDIHFRIETVDSTGTHLGKWNFNGGNITANDQYGGTVFWSTTVHPKRRRNGADDGGNNITSAGTQRALGNYFHVNGPWARCAIWINTDLSTSDWSTIYTAATGLGW